VSDRRGYPAWLLYLLAGGVAAVAYLTVGSDLAREVLYVGLGLSAALATVTGVRTHRPRRALPWWLLAASLLSNVAGGVLLPSGGHILPSGGHILSGGHIPGVQLVPTAADAFYLACHPLFGVGLLLLVRARVPGRDRAGLVDGLIVATGTALVAWVFLISPHLRDPGLDLAARAVSTAYPLFDVLMLAVAARLMVGGGARPPAYRLLGAGVVAMLATDVCHVVLGLNDRYQAGSPISAGWMAAYACAGAAALHPSMAWVATPADVPAPMLRRRRLAVLAGVSLLAPALLAVEASVGTPADVLVIAAGSALLSVLVAVRMAGLLGVLAGALTELQHRALHDVLTGLAQRELFVDRVEQALLRHRRVPGQVALLFIDLDDFKRVNDTLGHAAGDRLLGEVAGRLRTCLRAGDTAARLGGDEFAILLDGVPDPGLGAVVARRVLAALREPVDLHGMRVTVDASIGIATTTSGFDQAGTLLRRADVAMYAAKGGGKGRYSWFDPATHADEEHDAACQAVVGTGPPGHGARPRPGVGIAGPLADPRWPDVGAILGQVSARAAPPPAGTPGPGASALHAFANLVAERMQADETIPAHAGDYARRLAQVQAVTDAALAHLAVDDLLAALLERLKAVLAVDVLTLFLPTEDGRSLRLRAFLGLGDELAGTVIPMGEGVTGRVAATGTPMLVADLPMTRMQTAAAAGARLRAVACVPLRVEGRIIGTLGVGSEMPSYFGQADLELLQLVADRAALAIERTRLLEAEARARAAAERTVDRLSRLQAITAAFSQALTSGEVAEVGVRQGVAALDAQGGALALVDGDDLEVVATLGYPPEVVEQWRRMPLTGAAPLSQAARCSTPVFLGSPAARERCMPGWRPIMTDVQAWAAVPLAVQDRCLGVLGLTFDEPHAFAEEDRLFMVALAGHCGQAIERARLYEAERVAHRAAAARAEEFARRAGVAFDPSAAGDH